MIITIDGPAASGKSSIAKALSERLGCYYLYSGLFYRAVAYVLFNRRGKTAEDLRKIAPGELNFISEIQYKYINDEPTVFFQGEDVTKFLLESSLSQPASIISLDKNIREHLLVLLREVGKYYDLVADGRDCGSVVFPNAEYKFFLTASLDVRAKRALLDSNRKNMDATLEEVKNELEIRDKRDREREIAPLVVPEGAIIVDNSNLNFEQTLEAFLNCLK